jgi:hypothetical protein
MPLPTVQQVRSRLRPGELDRLAVTITRGATPETRCLAAAVLVLLAGPRRPTSASGHHRPDPAMSAAVVLAAVAESDAAWDAWMARTFGPEMS